MPLKSASLSSLYSLRFITIFIVISSIKSSFTAKTLRNRLKQKNCPIIKIMSDFVLESLQGTWFVTFSSVMNSSDKCDRFVFSSHNASVSLFRKYVKNNGIEMKMMGKAVVTEPGSFATIYPAYPCRFYSNFI